MSDMEKAKVYREGERRMIDTKDVATLDELRARNGLLLGQKLEKVGEICADDLLTGFLGKQVTR